MKQIVWILSIGLLALVLASCGSQSQNPAADPTGDAEASSALDLSYENALALRNQLALGTLQLEETDQPVTQTQAAGLLLLWQALRGTMDSGASAPAETNALLEQIEGAMSAEQLAAIGAMRLTQVNLQEWAQSQGLSTGTGLGGGEGSGQPGSGQSLSPEERATRQAEREASGTAGGGTSRAVIEAVIDLLETK